MTGSFAIRAARQPDQRAIVRLVRSAGIYPFDLPWERFVVAEGNGAIAGVVQSRMHWDGARELASLAVLPGARGQGIGQALVCEIQRCYGWPLYLICADRLETFYMRFHFHRCPLAEMPPSFRLIHAVANISAAAVGIRRRLLVMRWKDASIAVEQIAERA